jgi:2-polyprenyl-6-methoxyphenol hydroxylase-like FAD-dependent oxidoreductase
MLSANAHEVPVLVVGAGPAGLAAAIELARHGMPCLLIERRTTLSSHPRATVLSLRSMELVRAWGLEDDVRACSADVDSRMLESETLADAAAGTALQVGYPSAEQSRMVSPTTPTCVAQDDLEPLLLAHLRAAPQARVELGTELTGIFLGPAGARADLRDVRTGAQRTVHARYVVAADGARSAVRRALGIRLIGPDNLMEGYTTLFRAPLFIIHPPVIVGLALALQATPIPAELKFMLVLTGGVVGSFGITSLVLRIAAVGKVVSSGPTNSREKQDGAIARYVAGHDQRSQA